MISSNEQEIYRSIIRSKLLISTIRRGSLIAGIGVVIIFLGLFLRPSYLSFFGAPLFLAALFFIGIGWMPYRRLAQLQIKPHEIWCDHNFLIFLKQGKPLFQIATAHIQKISYIEKEHLYGIGVWLNLKKEYQVKVLQKNFNFALFVADSTNRFEKCTLFFPFFSKEAFEGILATVQPESDRAF